MFFGAMLTDALAPHRLQPGDVLNKTRAVLQGHTDELWGLDVHPSMEQFVTCSQDKQVHLWDTNSHQPLWSKTIDVSTET